MVCGKQLIRIICLGFFLLIFCQGTGQSQSLSRKVIFSKDRLVKTEIDTAKLLSDTPIKSPMGAVLRSAILPGWGQFYNEKYLKAIFVLSVNGTLVYAIYHYDDQWEKTGDKTYQDKRNLYTWYFGVSYFLTLVDAYVDAYLFGFDKAMKIAVFESKSGDDFGLCLQFNL